MRQRSFLVLTVVLGLVGMFSACSSSHKTIKAKPERVMQTSGGKRPEWAIKTPRFVKKDVIFVSGQSSIRGDQALAQGLLAAELDAKARLAGEIGGRLSRQMQSATEGFDIDNQTLRVLTSMAVDRNMISGSFIQERYYEKVAYVAETSPGVEQTRYDCFALAAIPLEELKKQMAMAWKEYEAKLQGKDQLTPELRQRFEKRWDQFFQEENLTATNNG